MKKITKQRVTQLHELFTRDNPGEKISLKDFVSLLKYEDSELWIYIKLAACDDWYDFIEAISKPDVSKDEDIVFDWDCLPAWANNYIAMDEDGTWYCYCEKPKLKEPYFYTEDKLTVDISPDYYPKNFKGNWKDSLFSRIKI